MLRRELRLDMQSHIDSHVAELRLLSFANLLALPEYSEEPRQFRKWEYTLATWRIQKADDLLQVVVQAYYRVFFGISAMTANGFRINSDGLILEIPEDERYKFHDNFPG